MNETPSQPVSKQVSETMFIMDSQLLGLLENQDLLNLETQKPLPFTSDKDTSLMLSEPQLVSFFMTRA